MASGDRGPRHYMHHRKRKWWRRAWAISGVVSEINRDQGGCFKWPKIPPLNELGNEANEWHTFWIGFLEPFCLWWRIGIPRPAMKMVAKEFHYYRVGKAFGVGAMVILLFAIALFIRGL